METHLQRSLWEEIVQCILTFLNRITYLLSSSSPKENDASPATSATSCLRQMEAFSTNCTKTGKQVVLPKTHATG